MAKSAAKPVPKKRRPKPLPRRQGPVRRCPGAPPGAQAQRGAAQRQRRLLHGPGHRGAGRPGAGPPAARHVYRRHRREGAASPVRRGDRQCHGRGAGGPCQLHRGGARRRRLPRRHRQWPRHSGRPAPEIPQEVRPRSHHVHAARRRQVRLQGLRDLRRPARRRRLGGQCAVGAARGRGRARRPALSPGLRARQAQERAGEARPHREPARHQGALQAGPADLRRQGEVQSGSACSRWRAPRPICSAASKSAGTATRSCCTASRTCRRTRPSTSPTVSRTISPPRWPGRRWSIPTSSPANPAGRAPTARSNGRWPGVADADGFMSSYCNTIPTGDGGTHEAGLARRAARAA